MISNGETEASPTIGAVASSASWNCRRSPLLIAVPRGESAPTKEDLLAYLADKVAKWWLPDDVAFVDELPHTATGKIAKRILRDQFKDYTLPTV